MTGPIARVRLAGAVVVGCLALTGCGSSSSSDGSAAQARATLRVQVEQGPENLASLRAFADGFEAAHPGVTVKLETISNAAKTGPNLAVVASAHAPDVAVVPVGQPAYEKLVAAGALADLAPVWKRADLDARYPAALNDQTTYRGRHYALSSSTAFYDLAYYNADLFAKNHIAVPANHRIASAQQLYDIARALRAGGSQPLAIGGKSNYIVSWMPDALLPTAVSPTQLSNYLSSWKPTVTPTARYTDAGFVKVLDQVTDYARHGVFQQGFLGADPGAAEAAFQAGRAGMVLSGSWYAGVLAKARPGFRYGWLLLPPVDAARKTQLTGYFGVQWAVPTRAANRALAMEFLGHMVSDAGQASAVIKAISGIPSVTSVPASAYSAVDPLVREMLADAKANGVQSGWTSSVPGGIGQALINPLMQSMLAGRTDPQAVAAKVQDALPSVRAAH